MTDDEARELRELVAASRKGSALFGPTKAKEYILALLNERERLRGALRGLLNNQGGPGWKKAIQRAARALLDTEE